MMHETRQGLLEDSVNDAACQSTNHRKENTTFANLEKFYQQQLLQHRNLLEQTEFALNRRRMGPPGDFFLHPPFTEFTGE